MTSLSTGFIALFNGLLDLLHALGSPLTLATVVSVASVLWLAGVEVEELDRQGVKPDVGRH